MWDESKKISLGKHFMGGISRSLNFFNNFDWFCGFGYNNKITFTLSYQISGRQTDLRYLPIYLSIWSP